MAGTLIIGIDPGLTGALATLAGGRVTTWRLPTVSIRVDGKARRELNILALREHIESLAMAGDALVIIEKVGGIKGQGAASSFIFGETVGMIRCVCEVSGLTPVRVHPIAWKARLGVTALKRREKIDGKEASRRVASALWPADAHQWRRKGDDGCAEAALLAEYGRRFEAGAA